MFLDKNQKERHGTNIAVDYGRPIGETSYPKCISSICDISEKCLGF